MVHKNIGLRLVSVDDERRPETGFARETPPIACREAVLAANLPDVRTWHNRNCKTVSTLLLGCAAGDGKEPEQAREQPRAAAIGPIAG
jgi:hypothetical protein